MATNNTSPSAEQVAENFQIQPLEPRLEMLSAYSRGVKEQPAPDNPGPDGC